MKQSTVFRLQVEIKVTHSESGCGSACHVTKMNIIIIKHIKVTLCNRNRNEGSRGSTAASRRPQDRYSQYSFLITLCPVFQVKTSNTPCFRNDSTHTNSSGPLRAFASAKLKHSTTSESAPLCQRKWQAFPKWLLSIRLAAAPHWLSYEKRLWHLAKTAGYKEWGVSAVTRRDSLHNLCKNDTETAVPMSLLYVSHIYVTGNWICSHSLLGGFI